MNIDTIFFSQSAKYCTMRQLDDGLLGKIVRYKSGKTKLLIGTTRYDLNLCLEPGMMQASLNFLFSPSQISANKVEFPIRTGNNVR